MPIRHLVTAGAAALALVALTACTSPATAEGAGASDKAAGAFAAAACSSWATFAELEETNADVPMALTGTGPEQHAAAIDIANATVDELNASSEAVDEAAAGLTDDGKTQQLFADYFQLRIKNSQAAIDVFAATSTDAGPNGSDVQVNSFDLFAGIAHFGTNDYSNPFNEIEDQAAIKALGEEPACADIVTVHEYF